MVVFGRESCKSRTRYVRIAITSIVHVSVFGNESCKLSILQSSYSGASSQRQTMLYDGSTMTMPFDDDADILTMPCYDDALQRCYHAMTMLCNDNAYILMLHCRRITMPWNTIPSDDNALRWRRGAPQWQFPVMTIPCNDDNLWWRYKQTRNALW